MIKATLLDDGTVRLRALEPEDLPILYLWENDPSVWGVSGTLTPFSKAVLRRFIEAQTEDIYHTRQYRFVIERSEESRPVGIIDLFDFDPLHRRAGVGVLVYDTSEKGKGIAAAALKILSRYAFEVLTLKQLFANIPSNNAASIGLFEKCGFVLVGELKEWLWLNGEWQNQRIYQQISPAI